jgi:hypothetical protein
MSSMDLTLCVYLAGDRLAHLYCDLVKGWAAEKSLWISGEGK